MSDLQTEYCEVERSELELVLEVDIEAELPLCEVLNGQDASLKLGCTMKYAKTARGQCLGVSPEILDQTVNQALVALEDSEVYRHIASIRLLVPHEIALCFGIVLEYLDQILHDSLRVVVAHCLKHIQRVLQPQMQELISRQTQGEELLQVVFLNSLL
jgi:hypothetical protein